MASIDKHVVQEIARMRDTIRNKLKQLKSGYLQTTYLTSNGTYKKSVTDKRQMFEPKFEVHDYQEDDELPSPVPSSTGLSSPVASVLSVSSPRPVYTPVVYIPAVASTSSSAPAASYGLDMESFIHENSIFKQLATYLMFVQSNAKGEADFTYGMHYDGNERKMGTATVNFRGTKVHPISSNSYLRNNHWTCLEKVI